MMSQEQFAEEIRSRVEQSLAGCKTEVKQMDKNNGIQRMGLIIYKQGEVVGVVLYMESSYLRYLKGRSLDEIAEDIAASYHRNTLPPLSMDEIRDIVDWEKMKGRVVYRLVHTGKNRRQLADMPYERFLDLAIAYFLYFGERDGQMFAMVTNEMMAIWGIDKEELHVSAEENMPELFPELLESLPELIGRMTESESVPGIQKDVPIYVLTNDRKIYGASAVLYSDALEHMAEKWKTDILLLPSSVHEWLLLPDDGNIDCSVLRQMVEEINREEVEPESRLSSNVYRYSRETGEISIAEGERDYIPNRRGLLLRKDQ